MRRTYYDVLQVRRDATPEAIKEAYRNLAWSRAEDSQDRLKEVNAAYAVLSSPERRAEYDLALAAGTAPDLPVVAGHAQDAPADRPTESGDTVQGPGFHPFLRLFSFASVISYWFSRLRYYYIPFNLILGAVAAVLLVGVIGNYQAAEANSTPHVTSIEKVVKGEEEGYISLVGWRSSEPLYEATQNGQVTDRFYSLFLGPNVLMVRGEDLPESGTFTGMLHPTEPELMALITKDAADPENQELRVATTQFLDAAYRPVAPSSYLWAILGLGAGILVLLVPLLFGYAVFRHRADLGVPPSPGAVAWPVEVLATGWFQVEGARWKRYEAFTPALLVRTGSPEAPLEARFDRVGRNSLVRHHLAIPAGSTVEWGYAFGHGKPLPAVAFRAGGKRTLVTLPSEAAARELAALFEGGSLNG